MKWPTAKLGQIAPPERSEREFAPDEVIWHLNLDQIESQTGRVLEKKRAPASQGGVSTVVFDEGNVLYSKLRPYLNKVVRPDEPGIATTELVPLRPPPKILNPDFLKFYLRSDRFVGFANQVVAGAKMPRMIMEKFWIHEIPLPAPREQRRIVELLEQADVLRQQRGEADKLAGDVLPAVFHKMFGEALTNQKNWPVVPMGKLIEEPQFGVSVALSDKTERKDGQLPVLRIANITKDGYLDSSDLRFDNVSERKKKELLLQKGDLLFNWRNSPNLVGKTAIFDADGDYIFASFLFRLKTRPLEAEVPYVWFFLNYLRRQGWFETKCRQAVSQANFGREELCAIPIPKPPLAVQKPFADCYDSFHRLKALRSQSGDQLERLFKIFMHHAFTGDLTAKWREAHLKELLAEMEHQARLLRAQC